MNTCCKPHASRENRSVATKDSLRLGTNSESLRFGISSPTAHTFHETTFRRRTPPIFWTVMGGVLIALVFYFLQALGMQSWSAPAGFFVENWFFVAPLILLFATQAGLFGAIHLKRHGGGVTLVASGGISSSAMFACCLHNLVFLLPLLGTTGIASFFEDYQSEVFLISILFAALGVLMMWRTYHSIHACHPSSNF